MRRVLIFLSLCSSLAVAQTTRYTNSFLEIPVGARGLGMGDAFVSLANDATAFHYNPAGTALIDTRILSMMYSSQYGSLAAPLANFFFLGYAQNLQGLNVSVDWVRLSVDNIPAAPDLTFYDSPAEREYLVKTGKGLGSFSSADDAVYLNLSKMYKFNFGLGWSLPNLPIDFPVGINFKLIHRMLDGHAASGVGIDGGFMIRVPAWSFFESGKSGRISFGMNIRDITDTRIAWDTQISELVPRSALWGFSYEMPVEILEGEIALAYSRDNQYGDDSFGGEYVYNKLLSLRVGKDSASLTVGAGISLDFMHVDYAFLAQSLGNVNRVSASFYLDKIFK
jgi:hypothetical protein